MARVTRGSAASPDRVSDLSIAIRNRIGDATTPVVIEGAPAGPLTEPVLKAGAFNFTGSSSGHRTAPHRCRPVVTRQEVSDASDPTKPARVT